MNLLVIGGTIFLGRHLILAAQARGHRVTYFHRGKRGPGLFPDATEVLGDRTLPGADGLGALDGAGPWDAVIDTCGYVPRHVAHAAERLAGRVGRYCFISTVSVYRDWPETPAAEDAPLATLDDPSVEEVTGETYGGLKALCEDAVRARYGEEASLIVRPGLIVGPHDISDRFAYWPRRIAQGGAVLAPPADAPAQCIDVRDLAEWTIRLIESGASGVLNGDGPVFSFADLLACCASVAGSTIEPIFASEAFLAEHEVASWTELPLWIPGLREKAGGGATVLTRALAAGLTHRPLAETVRATLDWLATDTRDGAFSRTLTREREADLIAAWRAA